MKRGFKAMAERLAEETRHDMGIRTTQKIDLMKLAVHVGAIVRRADELTDLSKLEELEEIQPGAFSACTFHIRGKPVVVYTPLASHGRMQSDIAHEIAHILLEHEVQSVHQLDGISFFTCDPDEEQEANWAAGCLLLPRKLLYQAARLGQSSVDVANEYGVSRSMSDFRFRATGVLRQLEGAKRRS